MAMSWDIWKPDPARTAQQLATYNQSRPTGGKKTKEQRDDENINFVTGPNGMPGDNWIRVLPPWRQPDHPKYGAHPFVLDAVHNQIPGLGEKGWQTQSCVSTMFPEIAVQKGFRCPFCAAKDELVSTGVVEGYKAFGRAAGLSQKQVTNAYDRRRQDLRSRLVRIPTGDDLFTNLLSAIETGFAAGVYVYHPFTGRDINIKKSGDDKSWNTIRYSCDIAMVSTPMAPTEQEVQQILSTAKDLDAIYKWPDDKMLSYLQRDAQKMKEHFMRARAFAPGVNYPGGVMAGAPPQQQMQPPLWVPPGAQMQPQWQPPQAAPQQQSQQQMWQPPQQQQMQPPAWGQQSPQQQSQQQQWQPPQAAPAYAPPVQQQPAWNQQQPPTQPAWMQQQPAPSQPVWTPPQAAQSAPTWNQPVQGAPPPAAAPQQLPAFQPVPMAPPQQQFNPAYSPPPAPTSAAAAVNRAANGETPPCYGNHVETYKACKICTKEFDCMQTKGARGNVDDASKPTPLQVFPLQMTT